MIVALIVTVIVILVLWRSVRIIPQANAGVVERFGRYHRTLIPGLNVIIPFVDRLRPLVDLREQVVSFPPQPVITEDNLVVEIDSVIYFQVTNAKDATYEITDYIRGVEQLTVTTLRNLVGGMDLERTLTSRDQINSQLRGILDDATGKWGIRVNRVELKAIDPPASVQESMEKQMRAERDRRAAILTAEGAKQSAILTAEGAKQSAILTAEAQRTADVVTAEGQAQAMVLRAEAEAEAIRRVVTALHDLSPTPEALAYTYLQSLTRISEGPANTLWVLPAELTEAMRTVSSAMSTISRRTPEA
ncbi:MAG: SPFH/Band 7/PHB domain protein [Actinomycetales bacterium]|nr:SPFH/Band 7/PHB domain protein [Actinomycetales bacterium]